MNYLSHQFVARTVRPEPDAPALFFAGNLLPDLLAVSGDARVRDVSGYYGVLAEGVALHLRTDRQFHGLAAFHAVQESANQLLLSAPWETPPRRRFFLAHVMTELALDAELLRQDPGLPGDLYGTLSEALQAGLVEETERLVRRPVPNLGRSIERFLGSRFLYEYATADGLASALARVSARAGVPNFADPRDVATLSRVFGDFSTLLAPRTEELLHPVESDRRISRAPLVVQ